MSDGESPTIRIVRERVVYANGYGNLNDDDVEFEPAGTRGRYVRWQWRAPYSVSVLALTDPGTALLVRNFRHSARREVLEAVKGFGDATRSPDDVARAELHEELGFTTDQLVFLGTTFADSAFAHHPLQCFLAMGRIDGLSAPENSEAIGGFAQYSLSRTPQALKSGEVQDSVTLLLLWQALHWMRKSDG
jgi:ADP-ribose pyrophosphatase